MTKINKEKFEEAVYGSNGSITTIAKRLSVNRGPVYNWMKKNEKIAKEILEMEENRVLDEMESQLVRESKKSFRALKFYLLMKGRKRGYVEKIENEIIGNLEPIKININYPQEQQKGEKNDN